MMMTSRRWIVVVLLVVTFYQQVKCCPSDCNCYISSSNECVIDCSSTGLETFQPSYENLSSLCNGKSVILDLSNNKLDYFGKSSISSFTSIKKLYLHGNNLQYINPRIFKGLDLQNITLSSNQWSCNCELQRLKSWVKENRALVDDLSSMVCSHPEPTNDQHVLTVNLNEAFCATDFVSCVWSDINGEAAPLIWEHSGVHREAGGLFDEETCIILCFRGGFSYASNENGTCLCAQNSEIPTSPCAPACSAARPTFTCGRKVVYDTIFSASLGLSISKLRPFSQYETAKFELVAKRKIFDKVTWYFNDGSSPYKADTSVIHKFPTSGIYHVSAIVQSGIGWEKISFPVEILSAFERLDIDCPPTLNMSEDGTINVGVKHGSSPYISWYVKHDGDPVLPTGAARCGSEVELEVKRASYLSSDRTCIKSLDYPATWDEGERLCKTFHEGAHLATIDTDERINFIKTNLTLNSRRYWIGFNDRATEGNYISSSGWSPLNTPWAVGQPSDKLSTNPPKDCVYLEVPSFKWYDSDCSNQFPFLCQFSPTDELEEPKHYVSGNVVFHHETAQAHNLSTTSAGSRFSEDSSLFNYVLLFPGLWIFENGKLNGWEAVLRSNSIAQTDIVSMQLYRPMCNTSFNLLLPGCTNYPIASCSLDSCDRLIEVQETCPHHQYHCMLAKDVSSSCRNATVPCNPLIEDNIDFTTSINLAMYQLISNQSLSISESGVRLYQSLFTGDDVSVERNDVIAVAFQSRVEVTSSNIEELPLVCETTNTSKWRQNAVLFNVENFDTIDSTSSTHEWARQIRCDVRVHYSTPSLTKFDVMELLNHTEEGTYEVFAAASNSLGHGTFSTCTIEVHNQLREVVLIQPKPVITEDGELVVYVPRGEDITLVFQAVGGDESEVIDWDYGYELTPRSIGATFNEAPGSSTLCATSTQVNCSRTSLKPVFFRSVGNSSLTVVGKSRSATVTTSIRMMVRSALAGPKILPENLERLVKGIQQIFTSYSDSGTDVTTQWYIDELTQYRVTKESYNVVFRKVGTYTLTMLLSNGITNTSTSIDIIVEELNPTRVDSLSYNEDIVAGTSNFGYPVIRINRTININTHITMDRNPDSNAYICSAPPSDSDNYTCNYSWEYNLTMATTPTQSTLEDDIEGSYLLDEPGIWRVKAYSNSTYRSDTEIELLDVREPITNVNLQHITAPGGVDMELEFRGTLDVSDREVTYSVAWKLIDEPVENSTINNYTSLTFMKQFNKAGWYDVQYTADNIVSSFTYIGMVQIFEQLTGLYLHRDDETERGQPTSFNVTAESGFDNNINITIKFDHSSLSDENIILNINKTWHTFTRTYPDSGFYDVTVQADHPINNENYNCRIQIFNVRVVEVGSEPSVFQTNVEGKLESIMEVNRDELFDFSWEIDGGTTNVEKNGSIGRTFTSSGIYNGIVTVTSRSTGVSNSTEFTVKVEDSVQNVSISSNNSVRTNTDYVVEYDVDGGTDVHINLQFGDGTSQDNNGSLEGNFTHVYTAPGIYDLRVSAENSVSSRSTVKQVIVEDPIQDLTLHSSARSTGEGDELRFYVVNNEEENYWATYSGTDVTITWEFDKSGTTVETTSEGEKTTHTYIVGLDDLTLTVQAANHISNQEVKAKVEVRAAVKNTEISDHPDIVMVGEEIEFTENGANSTVTGADEWCWKIIPPDNSTFICGTDEASKSIRHIFTSPAQYTVILLARNPADSQNATASVTAISALQPLLITVNDSELLSNVPVNEESSFTVLQEDGTSIFTTTDGITEYLTISWIIRNATMELTFTNEATISPSFTARGNYTVQVDVSNQVSNRSYIIEIQAEERLGEITLNKIGGFANLASVGEEVVIQSSIDSGTGETYIWSVLEIANSTQTGSPNFSYTFSSVRTYNIQLIVGNVLENKTKQYQVVIQSTIIDVAISVTDLIREELFVRSDENYDFRPEVDDGGGDDVTLQWLVTFNDIVEENKTIPYTGSGSDFILSRSFPVPGEYQISLNVSNLVSWKNTNLPVYSEHPIFNMSLSTEEAVYSSGTTAVILVNVSTEADVIDLEEIDYGDGSPPELMTSFMLTSSAGFAYFNLTHVYPSSGSYQMSLWVRNNVTNAKANTQVYVRDEISGLDIQGVCDGCFSRSDVEYNISASVVTGTNVTFTWTITNNGVTSTFDDQYQLISFDAGETTVQVVADNLIDTKTRTLNFIIEDPLQVSIEVTNETYVFVNYTVTFNINVDQGKDPVITYDFGDGNVIENITDTTINHIYSTHGDHQIKVVAYNNVSSITQHRQIYVKNLLCSNPVLWFVGGDGQQFYRSREIYLEIAIETHSCRAYNLQYQWRMFNQSSCDVLLDENEMSLPGTPSYPLLSLAALTLQVGTYCVQTTASYTTTPLVDSVQTHIEVISTPLAAVISGGTYRFVSSLVDVMFDASSSFDPDLDMDEQTELTYEWGCSSQPTNSTSVVAFASTSDNCFSTTRGDQITVTKLLFQPDREYNITMTTWKDGKAPVSTWQSVLVVGVEIPTVTIICTSCRFRSTLEVSASHHLVLQGSSDASVLSKSNYTWTAERRNVSDGISTIFELNEQTTTTGSDGRYLVVRTGELLPFFDYEFTLTVSVEGANGSSKLILHANKPPADGVCEMNYDGDQVFVLETIVRFSCSGWADESLSPLVYSILAIRQNGEVNDDNFILYKGTSPTYETYLPLGFADSEYGVNIQVLIEDELGTFSVGLNRSINVHLRSEDELNTIEWLENKTYTGLFELQRTNDPQIVADYIAGLVTVLNQNSESDNSTDADSNVASREQIRNNITRTVTSLNTNTFDEIRQVSAVFKQCLRVPSELQNVELQETGVNKIKNIAQQIRTYNVETSEQRYLAVISDLMDSVSYMIDSVNYHFYVTGQAQVTTDTPVEDSVLTEKHRKDMLGTLMASVSTLSNNVLLSKVEGEEATYINTTLFSSYGKRTTASSMNSTLVNDGCYIILPESVFSTIGSSIGTDEEIFYLFIVSQQNPFTYGYLPSDVTNANGVANISTRVPSLQFKKPSLDAITVSELTTSTSYDDMIKLVMAPGNRRFIPSSYQSTISSLADFSIYTPRDGVEFTSATLEAGEWKSVRVNNDNSDTKASAHIMVIYEKFTETDQPDPTPYIDVYLHLTATPNEWNYTETIRLTEDTIDEFSNHLNYTFYLEPAEGVTVRSSYFLNITNRYTNMDVTIRIGVYYSSCQYFNNDDQQWDDEGLATSPETTPSVAICYSNHLTSFGSFVISPPNLISFDEITNVDFYENPVAIILISVLLGIYIILVIIFRRLDLRDIEKVAMIPLCGRNGSFKYEVTVKTSSSIGSGTTANIGIRVYGTEGHTTSIHLYHKGAFQRGSVDSFYVASETDLGEISKIKIWHDNTGLDPGWNVSRIMVKDERGIVSYFLIDMWLQVYPDDEDEDTCLKKVVYRASEEELENFSRLFGSHISHGWEDTHLWWSLFERPQRSKFTRVQRLTCCVTLLYSYMALSALWYQDYDTNVDEIGVIRWKDIAVGAIVSLIAFPLNIIIVLLFKKTKVELNLGGTWRSRMPTAETVEVLDEDPRNNSRLDDDDDDDYNDDDEHDYDVDVDEDDNREIFTVLPTGVERKSFSRATSRRRTDENWSEYRKSSASNSSFGSKDTGYSSGGSPSSGPETTTIAAQLRRRHGGAIDNNDLDDNDFLQIDVSNETLVMGSNEGMGSSEDVDDTIINKAKSLRRTQNTTFQEDGLSHMFNPMSTILDEDLPRKKDAISPRSIIFDSRVSIESSEVESNEEDGDEDEPKEFLLPHVFIYIAYFVCFSVMVLSAFVVILKGLQLGRDETTRWVVSFAVSLLESFFIIEPIKVLFVVVYVMTCYGRRTQHDGELESDPISEMHEDVIQNKRSRIRPPAGFALEKCKTEALKARRLEQLIYQFATHTMLLWSLLAFVLWDRDPSSYWSHHTIRNIIFRPNHSLADLKTVDDILPWMNNSLLPTLLYNDSDPLDYSPTSSHLLGTIRLRQQRALEVGCGIDTTKYSNIISIPNGSCIAKYWTADHTDYSTGWSSLTTTTSTSSSQWIHQSASPFGIAYFGEQGIYDDSGYMVELDDETWQAKIEELKNENWLNRNSRVVFIEMTHINQATYWFVVSTLMFELDTSGVMIQSYQATIARLFRPSSGFFLDMLFIVFIALIGLVLWYGELRKIYQASSIASYLKKTTNWINTFVNITLLCICILFVIKEVKIEESMQTYLSNRENFTNFYHAANYSNIVVYISSLLLAVLMIKVVRLLRFVQGWSKFGEAYTRCAFELLNATIMLFIVVFAYAIVGYLFFGLGAIYSISSFEDFTTSLGSVFGAFRSFAKLRDCFDVSPIFATFYFFSYFMWIFIIICRLFASIVMEALRNTNDRLPMLRKLTSAIDAEIPSYFIKRLKLRLGIIKPKQFRPTVHFDGLSRNSSFDSLSTNDSFQTFFNPGRISQCSDVTGFSEFSNQTQSDHSISVFDYLTLGKPYDEREPMDSVHMEHLYDRLESYSVDMLLRKVDRVQKLSDQVLGVETDLLEISDSAVQSRKASTSHSEKEGDYDVIEDNTRQPRGGVATGGGAATNADGNGKKRSLSHRSSSEKDVIGRLNAATISSTNKQNTTVRRNSTRSANAVSRRNDDNNDAKEKNKNRRRPYSDEGARNGNTSSNHQVNLLLESNKKTNNKNKENTTTAAKKTAW